MSFMEGLFALFIFLSCMRGLKAWHEFNKARVKICRTMPEPLVPHNYDRHYYRFHDFFNATHPQKNIDIIHSVRVYNISGKPVPYLQNFKVASQLVNHNLIGASNHYGLQLADIKAHISWNYLESVHSAHNEQQLAEMVSSRFPSRSDRRIRMFTFIRDPIQKFISGLCESYYRRVAYRECHTYPPDICSITENDIKRYHVTTTAAEDMLRRIAAGDMTYIHQNFEHIHHFLPESTVLSKFVPFYIGNLANISYDWYKMNKAYGINVPLNTSVGKHAVDSDIFMMESSLKQAL